MYGERFPSRTKYENSSSQIVVAAKLNFKEKITNLRNWSSPNIITIEALWELDGMLNDGVKRSTGVENGCCLNLVTQTNDNIGIEERVTIAD